jgi:DNA segregation ATPase FtsK/SpoIIIE, S-DNA-T family
VPERTPIGYDLGLLCEAVGVVTRFQRADKSLLQRRVYVGFAKAGRLLLLLEDYGIIVPADSPGRHPVLVAREDRDAALERIREAAGKEPADDA